MSAALELDALRDAVDRLPEDRLSTSRAAALQQFGGRGMPSIRDEDWKYTNLRPVVDISNAWLANGAEIPTVGELPEAAGRIREGYDAQWLTIVNGQVYQPDIDAARAAGMDAIRLSESDRSLHFDAPLSDLNAALLHDGLLIRIDSRLKLTRPVGILIMDDASASIGVSQARIEIEAAPGSAVDLIEFHLSVGSEQHYANSVINLRLGEGASAGYVRIQDRDPAHCQTGRLNVRLGEHSHFNHGAFDLGGRLIRNDLDIDLAGPGSSATFSGLYLADGTQHIDNHTRIDHRVGPAYSKQEYRGILSGRARCVWNGKAIVHAGADGTDAQQANHNLLLSDKAEIDAKPELEIYAEDVKCSHGTTIGQLDDTALYYLRTRGLDRREARRLLTRAFAQAIVADASVAALRDAVGEMVGARLDQLTHGDNE